MSLEPSDPPSHDDLIEFSRDDTLARLEACAEAEAKTGDGRAMRILQRLIEAAGLRRKE